MFYSMTLTQDSYMKNEGFGTSCRKFQNHLISDPIGHCTPINYFILLGIKKIRQEVVFVLIKRDRPYPFHAIKLQLLIVRLYKKKSTYKWRVSLESMKLVREIGVCLTSASTSSGNTEMKHSFTRRILAK
jgi:hypothetical protein